MRSCGAPGMFSSYAPALSEPRGSPPCPPPVWSVKASRGPLWWSVALGAACLGGSMAKMEYDKARRPPGESPAAPRSRG